MDSVCFVSPRFPPYVGGVETHVSELANRARARFGKVSIITTDPGGTLPALEQNEGSGLRIYRVKSFAPHENYHFPRPMGLLRCLRDCNAQVLHLHSIHDVPGPLAGLVDGTVLVLTPHFVGRINSALGRFLFSAYRPVLSALVRRVARVICMSQFERRLMMEEFPGCDRKIRVIPNGVDALALSKYSWKEPLVPRILYAGRLERYKNVDKLMRAFASLRRSDPEIRLSIVGRGPARNELVGLTRQLGLGESVEWFERLTRSELYTLYSESTMVVVPSQFENYGIVPAETISLGVPTVVANSSALSEFVAARLARGVDPPVSPEGLESAISNVLMDPKAYSLRDKASPLIPSWDEVAERTFALYESLN